MDVDLSSSASVTDIMLPQDPFTNVLTVNTTLTVLEDQRYTAEVALSNLAGVFSNTIETNFGKIYKRKKKTSSSIYILLYSKILIHLLKFHFSPNLFESCTHTYYKEVSTRMITSTLPKHYQRAITTIYLGKTLVFWV